MKSVRYKQIATTDWDINSGYDVGTTVEYDGDTYVSLKVVPVGVNIGFSDYWKKITIEDDVEDLKEDVAGVIASVSALNDNTIHKMTVKISGNVPTTTELAEIHFDKTGTVVVDFVLNEGSDQTTVRSSMIYTRATLKYGAGILFSFYSNGVISYVRTNNNVWSITPITLTT